MTTQQLTTKLRTAIHARSRKANDLGAVFHLGEFYRRGFRENHDLPASIGPAAYGIAYALQTCRLSGTLDRRIRHMTPSELCTLVAHIALTCPTPADVPAEIIRWADAHPA